MQRSVTALLLCLVLLLSGCASRQETLPQTETPAPEETPLITNMPPPAETPAPEPVPAPEETDPPFPEVAPSEAEEEDGLLPHEFPPSAEPEETAAPAQTQAPAETDLPAETDVPASTEAPEETPASSEQPEPEPAPAPAPESAPTPAPAVSGTDLQQQISELVSSFGGSWSVYFKRMDTGESFCIGDTPMVAASLIKLFVYGTAREQIEAGTLSADVWSASLSSMITVSDNDACNMLIDAVGGFDAVNGFIQRHGYGSSQLNRKMLYAGPENYTSTRDCGAVLEAVLGGWYVSADTSSALLTALTGQTRTWKIPAGVPAGVVTGNKTGELAGVQNDAAIVFSPACTYILCVMSGGVDDGTGIANIVTISSTVYSALNG